jgi:AraC family transcriptional regulator, transcriptional activator of pobA
VTTIPTLELAKRSGDPVRVEHIVPSAGPVDNDVHRHDYDELFFFATGSGTHMIDLEQRAVASPGMHLVGAGQVHQLSRSADMHAVVVQFGTEALLGRGATVRAELFARVGRPCAVLLDEARIAEAQGLVASIERELQRRGPVMAEVVAGYLDILLITCAQWVREQATAAAPQPDEHDPVRRFQELVEQGYLHERQVAHYADRLALSADRLNDLVRKRLGRTASSVIHERLLLEARRLLLHSELSIKEVGYALNLQDPAYFARWFRKADGRSPAEYRQHIREKYQR